MGPPESFERAWAGVLPGGQDFRPGGLNTFRSGAGDRGETPVGVGRCGNVLLAGSSGL
jgi:hypothetical protein